MQHANLIVSLTDNISRLQVLYQFHQVTAAAAKMTDEPDKSYPAPADTVVSYLQVFNFEFLQWVPPACIKPGATFYDTLVTKTVLPLLLIGVIVLVAALKLMRPSTRNNQRKRDKAIAGAVQGVSLLIELVLPSVSTTICQTFVCDLYDDFPVGGASRPARLTPGASDTLPLARARSKQPRHLDSILPGALRADNTLLCDMESEGRAFWYSYGTVMFLIYPIAMPCILVGIFYVNRKEIDLVMNVWKQHDDECIARGETTSGWTIQDAKVFMARPENGGHEISGSVMALAPNFMKFDPSCWWMGTFLLVVRIFQTSLLIFLSDPEVQSTFGAFVSLICVCVLREFEPYRISSDDTVGVLSQWMLFIFMSILLLVRVDVVEKIPDVLLGLVLVFIVFGLFGIAIKQVYDDYKTMSANSGSMRERGVGSPRLDAQGRVDVTPRELVPMMTTPQQAKGPQLQHQPIAPAGELFAQPPVAQMQMQAPQQPKTAMPQQPMMAMPQQPMMMTPLQQPMMMAPQQQPIMMAPQQQPIMMMAGPPAMQAPMMIPSQQQAPVMMMAPTEAPPNNQS